MICSPSQLLIQPKSPPPSAIDFDLLTTAENQYHLPSPSRSTAAVLFQRACSGTTSYVILLAAISQNIPS